MEENNKFLMKIFGITVILTIFFSIYFSVKYTENYIKDNIKNKEISILEKPIEKKCEDILNSPCKFELQLEENKNKTINLLEEKFEEATKSTIVFDKDNPISIYYDGGPSNPISIINGFEKRLKDKGWKVEVDLKYGSLVCIKKSSNEMPWYVYIMCFLFSILFIGILTKRGVL